MAGLLPEKEGERHREEGSKTEGGRGKEEGRSRDLVYNMLTTSFHLLFLWPAWARKFLNACGSQRAMWVFLNVL